MPIDVTESSTIWLTAERTTAVLLDPETAKNSPERNRRNERHSIPQTTHGYTDINGVLLNED